MHKPDSLWEHGHPLLLIFAITVFAAFAARAADDNSYPYSPAVLTTQGLRVFPFDGKVFTIPVPFVARVDASFDGRFLYGHSQSAPPVSRIELNPTRTALVRVGDRFDSILSLAVSRSEEMLVIAGHLRGTPLEGCSLYEIQLANGRVQPLMHSASCVGDLSLSPSGEQAAGRVNGRLALIDLAHGATTFLGESMWKGAWSPDGKWIAALVLGKAEPSKTVLIDATDLSRRRDLGGTADTEAVWSPDSRYILHSQPRTGSLLWTYFQVLLYQLGVKLNTCEQRYAVLFLEVIDVQTGKRSTIRDSDCNFEPGGSLVWVSDRIGR